MGLMTFPWRLEIVSIAHKVREIIPIKPAKRASHQLKSILAISHQHGVISTTQWGSWFASNTGHDIWFMIQEWATIINIVEFILVSHRTSIASSVMKFPRISKQVYIYMHIDLLTSCFLVRMSLEAHTICWSESHSDSCEDFTQGDALMALMWLIEGAETDAVILDLEEVGEREGTDDSVVIWALRHSSEASSAKNIHSNCTFSHQHWL